MENPFFNRLSRALWGGIVVLIVMLAIYVSVGRMLAANLTAFRGEILQALNARVPFTVEAQQVSGEWQSFTPVIVLTGLRLSIPGSLHPPLELSEGRISVDVLNSLRSWSVQLTRVELNGLSLRGELSPEGELRFTGFADGADQGAGQLREFLLNVEFITLRNNRLLLTMPSGEVRDLGLELQLSRDGSLRRLEATLSSTRGAHILVQAQGVGDPFQPELLTGHMYLDIQSTDLGAVKDLLGNRAIPVWADGAADVKLWLTWDKGHPTVETRLEARDLVVAGQDADWRLPLERVALEARLARNTDNWTLFVENLQLAQGNVELALPRLQLDTRGNTLRVRASDVPLEPLSALVIEQESVAEPLRRVLTALRPRGRVSALQVDIADINRVSERWTVAANFESVAVDSYLGAPGITSATGYTRIAEDGGLVILDSQPLTLEFPSIYHQPLHFEDLYGRLNLDWDADRFRIDSGLLTTRGEEGTTKVLFGLNIPLVPDDIGIEMDLLVGLQNSRSIHRGKYIPYVLDPSLLDWLSSSIGEGRIEQGAFLWRGSLRHNAAPLRTVQLAFNVADTHLSYHPQWPPVLVQEGIVLIDDSAVSVWADRASLFDSAVERLSVETRLNAQGQITLALDGAVRGPAADGLKVLNESALAPIVGPAFADWQVTGNLETDLSLRLNLTDKSAAPDVEVATRWRDVNLLVRPGNLPVQAVNGDFTYSTATGFSSQRLEGSLWGKAVSARLKQHYPAGESSYDPATTMLDVALDTRVDMADLRRWLQLESLAFVSGETAADVTISLAPGESPVLTVSSELQGVSLDLPQPWRKSAEESRQLELTMPLGQGSLPLSLALGEQLNFKLDIVNGVVRGGALGIGEEPAPAREGELRVTGRAHLIQADEWLDFVTRYFGEDEPGQPATQDAVESPRAEAAPGEANAAAGETIGAAAAARRTGSSAPRLAVVIDRLQAQSLAILQQEIQDVVFSLALLEDRWSLSLATDWLRAELAVASDGSPSQLAIEKLDLDRLPDFKLPERGDEDDPDGGSAENMALTNVTVGNLFQSEKRLGDLHFELHGENGVFTAHKISGQLAGLRFSAAQPGRLVWHRGQGGYTELQAGLEFADLGETLQYFGYQRIVETKAGEFQLDLRWPGAPQDYSLRAAQGFVQVAIGQGSFLEAPAGATGALRVVSILNLADIVRRLSLTQMFESGIPFDSVKGEIDLRDGLLHVARMDVQGSSSFQFSGTADVATKGLDGELVATLPVASNLPWIAALAASLPVAAGVYVVSKVFDEQMARLSSAVYTIKGSWDDPKVQFHRIFDNTAQAPDAAPPATSSTEKAGETVPAQSGPP